MPLLLFLLFLVMPLVEIWVIIQIGGVIGGWWTVLLLLGDSILGAWIVGREGRRTWRKLRDALGEQRWPADEVLQGAMVLFGGALLLTPGFVTDAFGLVLVLPFTRAPLATLVRTRMTPVPLRIVEFGVNRRADHRTGMPSDASPYGDGDDPRVLDVEVISIEPDEPESP